MACVCTHEKTNHYHFGCLAQIEGKRCPCQNFREAQQSEIEFDKEVKRIQTLHVWPTENDLVN